MQWTNECQGNGWSVRPMKNQWWSEVWTFVLAYIRANELIKDSHPGTKDGDIQTYPGISGDWLAQKYPDISGPDMVVSIFAMTLRPKQSHSVHVRNLEKVLHWLQTAGMCLKCNKCHFMLPKVEYLGHVILHHGLQSTAEKVHPIKDAPPPTNLHQLKSFLGLINFHSKFLPNLSTTLAPLYPLLQKTHSWSWGPQHQSSFEVAKNQSSSSFIVHYCDQHELLLSCDASSYSVGTVLSHWMHDGFGRPVAYASCSLAPAEKNYAQLDREALASVLGVTKLRQYLLGRHFILLTNHKPLIHLFEEQRAISPMSSSRSEPWALILSAYHYSIQHKPGKQFTNADVLSRLLLPNSPAQVPMTGDMILLFETLCCSSVSAADIKCYISRDPVLAKVRNYILQG